MMEWPGYDAAIAANIIAVAALLVAFWSIKVAWRAERRLEDAWLPEISARADVVEKAPDWICVRVAVENISQSTIFIESVRMIWPVTLRAVSDSEAEITNVYGSVDFSAERAKDGLRRTMLAAVEVRASGTASSHFGRLDRGEIRFYFKESDLFRSRILRFSVSFSRNRSDMRRLMRHVSMQRIIVPTKQPD